jgi:flagellar hook-associated protein 2
MYSAGGISTTSQIEQLLVYYRYLEEEPVRRYESQKSGLEDKSSIYDELKTKLKSFGSKALDFTGVGSLSPFQNKNVTYGSEGIVEFEVSNSAQASNYSIKVNQLAKYDTVISDQITLENEDLRSTLGTGSHSFDLTVGSDSAISIDIDIESDDTNEDIMNKIISSINDESDLDVKASLVKDTDTTGRLNITTEETGADFRLTIADSSSTIVSAFGIDTSVQASGASGGYLYLASELNAQFVMNGISIERSLNTLDDVIEGVTIKLLSSQDVADSPASVSITQDTEAVRSNIDEFIKSFNEIIDYIDEKTKIDTATYTRGPLTGDTIAQKAKTQLREYLTEEVTSVGAGDPSFLFQIGISFNSDGKLEVSDSDELTEALENNLSSVEALFNGTSGVATKIEDWLDDFLGADGSIVAKKESLSSQIRYLDQRIDSLDKAIEQKMEYYTNQFTQLQGAMYMAQSQLSYMSQLSSYY